MRGHISDWTLAYTGLCLVFVLVETDCGHWVSSLQQPKLIVTVMGAMEDHLSVYR